MNEEARKKMPEWKSVEQMATRRFGSLKEVAELISVCPHIVPAGIGIPQYIEELRKGARQLNEFLIQPEDIQPLLDRLNSEAHETPDQG